MKKTVFFLLFLPITLFAYSALDRPVGFVSDFASVLSVSERSALEEKLARFEKETGNELAVVIIKSLKGGTIEDYAVSLFADWGIGKEAHDNGVLLLVSMDDRKMRIEVGYGLEGALTDIQSNSIIKNTLRPAFQRGDYYGGINMAVDDIEAATRGEYAVSSMQTARGGVDWYFDMFAYAAFAFIWLSSILARSKSWWAGGVIGAVAGIIVSFVFGFLYVGLLSLVLFVPFGLLLDFIVSRAYQRGTQSGHYPWWIGGGPHGGFGGGRGFGGFGGGHSGGGGSSGDW